MSAPFGSVSNSRKNLGGVHTGSGASAGACRRGRGGDVGPCSRARRDGSASRGGSSGSSGDTILISACWASVRASGGEGPGQALALGGLQNGHRPKDDPYARGDAASTAR